MKPRQHHESWSLRPEDLLIESARYHLVATAVINDTRQSRVPAKSLGRAHVFQSLILTPRRALIAWRDRLLQRWSGGTTVSKVTTS